MSGRAGRGYRLRWVSSGSVSWNETWERRKGEHGEKKGYLLARGRLVLFNSVGVCAVDVGQCFFFFVLGRFCGEDCFLM